MWSRSIRWVAVAYGKQLAGIRRNNGLPDPSRNFVTVDCWHVLRIDDRLDCHIAAGVAQKAADLAECDGSDAFQAADSAGDAEFAVVVAEQRFFAEMDVQHYPRAEFG